MFSLRKTLVTLLCSAALGAGVITVTLAPPTAMAQSDLGAINGVITDASGAVITNASVTVTNTATGATRVSNTNSKGEYAITQLNPSDYTISVTAPGFGTTTQSFTLSVGSTREISLKLAVAGSQTEVTVTMDDTTSVHLENQEISTVITNEQIQNLPLTDRNPYSLVSLSGNISSQIMGGDRGVGFEMSGSRSASVDILLDGAENTDLYAVGIGQSVPQDAVQEFSVVVGGQGVEYGRASGGAVNVSTKTGTNTLHGDVYDYNRISTFASDGFSNNALWAAPDHSGLTSPKSRYVHNQFGYFAGGPIKKDKLFFSSATEWTRVRSGATVVSEVPLSGLIGLAAANTQSYFATYGANLAHPVNGKTYTGADLVEEGVFATDITTLAATNPSILTTPLFGTVAYQNPGDSGGGNPQNTWINIDRIDYTISDKTALFGRYIQENSDVFPGTNNTSPYAGYNTGTSQKNYDLMVSVTHTFTPSLASNTKILTTRFNNQQPLGSVPVSPTLYTNAGSSVTLGSGTLYFPGYLATSPGNAIPFGGPQNFIQVGDDVTWTKGKHSFKFGGEFLNVKDNRVFGAYENAVDALVQTGEKGALINFVNGNLGEVEVALNPNGVYPCTRALSGAYQVTPACEISLPASSPNFSRSNRYQDGAAYASDTYKASPRLTIDAGLRWEVYGPQHSQRASYDANFFLANEGNEFDDIRDGTIKTRETAPNGRLWNLNLKQFGPRIGFAYDLTGNGRTSIRGGYGLSYERNFNNVTFNVIQNPPNYAVVALTTLTPISNNNLGEFGTGSGAVALPNTTLRAVDPHIKPAYSQNWSLTVEHQLDPSTLVSVGYIGSRGIHNYSIANINREFSGGNYLGDAHFSNRLNLQYSNINFRGADGDSYYEGVNLGIRSNNFHHTGLSAIANYTLSHSMDNNSSTFGDGANVAGGGLVLGYLDPFNHALDLGDSDFDIRHRVTAALTWNMPFFNHSSDLVKTALGGWVASTNFDASTGNPYTIFDCGFAYTVCPRVSFAGQRPAKLSSLQDISTIYGPNTYSYQNLPAYTDAEGNFNTAGYNEFTNPGSGTSDTPLPGGASLASGGFVTGMDRRNSYFGPGVWHENFKMAKSFKVHERYGLNVSATFINIFNHANTFLNLGGANDVSSYDYTLAFKSGNRNTELEARFVF